MKRLFSISLVVALLLLLASCDRSKTASGFDNQSAATSAVVRAAESAAKIGIDQSLEQAVSVTEKYGSVHKLIKPNGNLLSGKDSVWKRGKTYTIRWSSNYGGTVKIFLYNKLDIVTSTANDGRYRWTIPSTLKEGNEYHLMVQLNKSPYSVASSGYFTIKKGDSNVGTGGSKDYKFLNRYNAYLLDGYTTRWKSKRIYVSGAKGNWRAAVSRWKKGTGVRFRFVKSRPPKGKGIEILGYGNTGKSCGIARWAYWSNGTLATCKLTISSKHGSQNCGPEADTVAHEVGHCIGFFKHTSDRGLMDATADCRPNCAITSPVSGMIKLLYALRPGTNINSKLSRSPAAMRRPKESKYDPAGKKIYYGSSYFLSNGVVKIVEGW